jgi:hypothetical protein
MIFMPSAEEANIVRGKDGKLRLENFYTPLAEAKKEIQRRRRDKELRKKVEDFLGGDVPGIFKKEPKAIFARHVISLNYELCHFLKVCKCAEMDYSFIEYTKDRFSSKNNSKYHLCRLLFHDGKSKNGDKKISGLRIANITEADGKILDSLQTNWNEKLVDFHHRLFNIAIPDIKNRIFDVSFWEKRRGKSIQEFYKYYLSLFIRNGILFENFLLNEEEADFTKRVAVPTFNKIEEYFGIKPLIVRMLPKSTEEELFWFQYQGFLKPIIKNMMKIKK